MESWSGSVPMIELPAQRGQHLLVDHRLGPALSLKEVWVGLCGIDAVDQRLAHVFVREPERVPSFVADDPLVLAFRSVHGETLEVHGLPVLRYQPDDGPQIGVIASRSPGNTNISGPRRLDE
jgi:hypothetical protein